MHSISFLLLISFTGVIFLSLPFGSFLQKIPIIIFAIYLLTQPLLKIYKDYFYLGILSLIFLFYAFLSALVNTESLIAALLLASPYIIFTSIFLILARIKYEEINLEKLKRIFLLIFSIQVIFAVIKLMILGRIDEGFLIGTMSHKAGQLSFLIPAICIPIFIFLYANKNIKLCIFLIFLALIFGLLNEKRSIVYLSPFIIFASFIVNSSVNFNFRNIFSSLTIFIAFIFIMIQLSTFLPSLSGLENANMVVEGNQLVYVLNYAYQYLNSGYGSALQGTLQDALYDQRVQLGRITLLFASWEYFLSQDALHQFFGAGFGAYTENQWVYAGGKDRFFEEVLFRGAFSGLLIILLEVGYLGLLIHLAIFYSFYKTIRKNIKTLHNSDLIKWSRIVFIIFFVFVYDFFFYSMVLFRTLPMPLIFLLIYFSLFYVRDLDKKYKTN